MRRRTLILGGLAAAAFPSAIRAAQQAATPALNGPRQTPVRAPAQFLVVLCHGYGADGNDLFGLVPEFQPYLPTAAFVSPNGPQRIDLGYGYQWFPPGQVAGAQGVLQAMPILNAFADAELARLKLTPDRLILVGFSQGAMMVLNTGIRRPVLPAAIVAYAGARVAAQSLPKLSGAPPVMMIQGSEDGDQAAIPVAVRTLREAGAAVQSHILPGLGHSIDDRGIKLAGEFLRGIVRSKTG